MNVTNSAGVCTGMSAFVRRTRLPTESRKYFLPRFLLTGGLGPHGGALPQGPRLAQLGAPQYLAAHTLRLCRDEGTLLSGRYRTAAGFAPQIIDRQAACQCRKGLEVGLRAK